jgi:hypothetical protein
MNNDLLDPELERRFREALAEKMPYLESPERRGHTTFTDRTRTSTAAQHIDGDVVTLRRGDRPAGTATRRRRTGAVAACLLALTGAGAAAIVASDADTHVRSAAPVSLPVLASDPVIDPTSGPLLTSALSADTTPMIITADPGWKLTGRSDVEVLPAAVPTTACAGCGADRLIVAADGPLFSGPMFTAWTISEPYDITNFDLPVTIGTTTGRYDVSSDAASAGHYSQVRVVWPVGDGRTAFVDATGLDQAQVFSMASSLTFGAAVPTLPNPPAGFAVRTTPTRAETKQIYLNFVYDKKTVPSYDGNSTIELIALSGGLQSLLDWRAVSGDPFRNPWTPAIAGGITVVLDDSQVPPQPPVLSISATWIAGDWAYVAIGHVFNNTQEFLDALTQLQLTDPATFADSAAGADASPLGTIDRGVDGSGGTLIWPEAG